VALAMPGEPADAVGAGVWLGSLGPILAPDGWEHALPTISVSTKTAADLVEVATPSQYPDEGWRVEVAGISGDG
jgi:hypothetical protein